MVRVSNEPSPAVQQYLHGHHESVLRVHARRTVENSAAYLAPHLSPELHLLDDDHQLIASLGPIWTAMARFLGLTPPVA